RSARPMTIERLASPGSRAEGRPDDPLLSIVVVSFNTRELTRRCLASLRAHTGGIPTQVIVVDNASADGSAEMVRREYPEVELVANDDNRGFAAANNQAFRRARGRWVLLL